MFGMKRICFCLPKPKKSTCFVPACKKYKENVFLFTQVKLIFMFVSSSTNIVTLTCGNREKKCILAESKTKKKVCLFAETMSKILFRFGKQKLYSLGKTTIIFLIGETNLKISFA